MATYLKNVIKKAIGYLTHQALTTKYGRYILDETLIAATSKLKTVTYKSSKLSFYVPNALNRFRVDTFSVKEPETLEWIDLIPETGVLWDIGANVVLYSCYAAKSRDCLVYAFEPFVFNLEWLAKNIYINSLEKSGHFAISPFSHSQN